MYVYIYTFIHIFTYLYARMSAYVFINTDADYSLKMFIFHMYTRVYATYTRGSYFLHIVCMYASNK